ncbi:hypothetical protein Hdeb2414_s0005g00172501 [Helianthus debilis subsp. tardiflorus]
MHKFYFQKNQPHAYQHSFLSSIIFPLSIIFCSFFSYGKITKIVIKTKYVYLKKRLICTVTPTAKGISPPNSLPDKDP